jgi:hypothetical protein
MRLGGKSLRHYSQRTSLNQLQYMCSSVLISPCMLLFAFELELIQTQMTQKPMLRAEVYARALRASQNRKEDSL